MCPCTDTTSKQQSTAQEGKAKGPTKLAHTDRKVGTQSR